jgi:hypothetical protein
MVESKWAIAASSIKDLREGDGHRLHLLAEYDAEWIS